MSYGSSLSPELQRCPWDIVTCHEGLGTRQKSVVSFMQQLFS